MASVLRAVDEFAGSDRRDDATILALRRMSTIGHDDQASVAVATGAEVG